jgi:Flp pilus assembly protein TadD
VWIAVGLAAVAFVTFAQSIGHGFIAFDDPYYVFKNPYVTTGLAPANLRWAFTSTEISNWHPLTWVSLQLDAAAWGTNPAGFHLTNVLLHAANAALLFLALRGLTLSTGVSSATALLFAVHPLRVESVAWISERKDVLSTFFGLLALWAWGRYVMWPSVARYLVVCLALALSLMAKPMFVTLPCLLLVFDWWPCLRMRTARDWPRLLIEKTPLFLLVIGSAWLTYVAQSAGGATRSLTDFSLPVRTANAVVSYAAYARHTLWPSGLAFYYPHAGAGLPAWQARIAVILLIAATAVAFAMRRRAPYLLVGWLWYLGTLVPVIGIVQVGNQAMADRYTYFPQIGLLLAVCAGAGDLLANRRPMAIALTAGLALALVTVTTVQLRLWHDPFALFQRSLDITGPNRSIYECLAAAYEDRGELDEAEQCFRKALECEPDEVVTLTSLGTLLAREGRLDEAAEVLERARDRAPEFPLPHSRLESVYLKQGKLDKAAAELIKFCALVPNSPEGYNDLGTIYLRQNRLDDAIRLFRKACEVAPDVSEGYMNLGLAEERRGDFAAAAESYARAVKLRPDFYQARAGLGVALSRLGRRQEGLAHLQAAVQTEPGFVQGHVLLGKALANAGDFAGAATQLAEALRLDPKQSSAWRDLAMVQQRLGRPAEASESSRRAAELEAHDGAADTRAPEPKHP